MVAVVGVVSLLALAGCTDAPEEPLPIPTSSKTAEPTPTPEYTPGVDPEADVAAAIKTYEAYVEASNELVLAERATWDPVLDLLAEPYRSESVTNYEGLAESGLSLEGDARVLSTLAAETQPTIIVLAVCTDFSQTRTRDSDGQQVGEDSGYAVRAMNVVFQTDESSDFGWLIYHFGESDAACG